MDFTHEELVRILMLFSDTKEYDIDFTFEVIPTYTRPLPQMTPCFTGTSRSKFRYTSEIHAEFFEHVRTFLSPLVEIDVSEKENFFGDGAPHVHPPMWLRIEPHRHLRLNRKMLALVPALMPMCACLTIT